MPLRRRQLTARWSMPSSALKVSMLTTSKASWRGKRSSETLELSAWEPATSPILFDNLVIVQADEENGERIFHRRSRQEDRQRSLEDAAKDAGELVHSVAGAHGDARGIDRQWHRIDRSLTIRRPAKNCGGTKASRATRFLRQWRTTRWFISSPVIRRRSRWRFVSARTGDLTGTPNVPWKYAKGTAYVPSPILYGDYLYLTTDRGILTCYRREDRRSEIRRRTNSDSGDVHCFSGCV